jgi:hypothetical protein
MDLKGNIISVDLFSECYPSEKYILTCTIDNEIDRNTVITKGQNSKKISDDNYYNGGIKFFPSEDIAHPSNMCNIYINKTHYWIIEFYKDSKILINTLGFFRVNKFNAIERHKIEDLELWDDPEFCKSVAKNNKLIPFCKALSYDFYIELVKEFPNKINVVPKDKITYQMACVAISHNGMLLSHIKNQSLELCQLAVMQNYKSFHHAKFRDVEMCEHVVSKDANIIKNIEVEYMTENVCKAAVTQLHTILKFIPNEKQTLEICQIAFDGNFRSFQYCYFKTDQMIRDALSKNGMLLEFVPKEKQTLEYCQIAMKRNPPSIQFAEFQNDDIVLHVIQKNGTLLEFVKNKTPEICNIAITNTINAFQFYDNWDDDTISNVLNKDGQMIRYIKNPTEAQKMIAINKGYYALQYIENQNDELCNIAIKLNPLAIKFCKNPSDKMITSVVNSNWELLKYIPVDKITKELCDSTIKTQLLAFEFIPEKYRTYEMMNIVLDEHPHFVEYIDISNEDLIAKVIETHNNHFKLIKDPTEKICLAFLKNNKTWNSFKQIPKKNLTHKICYRAVKLNPFAIKDVPHEFQTEEMCIIAVVANQHAITHCKYKTPLVFEAMVKNFGNAIDKVPIDSITDEIAMIAVSSYGSALRRIPKVMHTYEMVKLAIENSGYAIEHARQDLVTEELYAIGVNKDPFTVKYVLEQTDKIKWAALLGAIGGNTNIMTHIFGYIKDPTEEMINFAVDNDPSAIAKLENPTLVQVKTSSLKDKYFLCKVPFAKRNRTMCLKGSFYQPHAYTYYHKYKDDKCLLLAACLLNPKFIDKLDNDALAFIVSNPFIDNLMTELNNDENNVNDVNDVNDVNESQPLCLKLDTSCIHDNDVTTGNGQLIVYKETEKTSMNPFDEIWDDSDADENFNTCSAGLFA